MLITIASTFFVYILFWSMAIFLVLPFSARERGKHGDATAVPGQDAGAPRHFNGRRVIIRTTIVATIAYAVFYANYVEGWVTLDDVSLVHPPASVSHDY